MGKLLGLVAGNGELPLLVAQGARAQGYDVVTAALLGETGPELKALSQVFVEVKIGQLGPVLKVMKQNHVGECVMVGGFTKKKLFGRVSLDLTTLKVAARVGRQLQEDKLLREVADLFAREGVTVMPVPPFIPDHMAPEGVMTKKKPTPDEEADIQYGMSVARMTGSMDV